MNRTVLVTGANRGIGLAFTGQLLARGDHVVATCRHPGKAAALNALGGEHPGRLHVLPLDVASEKSRAELARELPLVLGEDGHLDLLINNAGVLHSGERWGHLSAAVLEDSMRTNAFGPLLLTQALDSQLADGTTVANMSSMMSSLAEAGDFHSPSYRISKTALNMVTIMLARALEPRGIKAVALCPGWVKTDMGGEGAQITPTQAVTGLLRVLDGLTPAQSGSFIDWQGKTRAW